MLNADDFTQMRADLLSVRDDRAESIVIRRGTTTLAAQSVRIVMGGNGRTQTSGQATESRSDVYVIGAVDLDVQTKDRFTVDGVLYQVVHVQPNREISTVAEVEAVQ